MTPVDKVNVWTALIEKFTDGDFDVEIEHPSAPDHMYTP